MKKRILSMALVFLLAFSLLPFGALADGVELSGYTEIIRQLMSTLQGEVYGTFADLDQDGTPDLILTGSDGRSGRIFVRSIGSDLNWTTNYNPGDDEAFVLVFAYPDDSCGIMTDNVGSYGNYAGKDDQGRSYYWRDNGDTFYQAVNGQMQKISEARSYGMETRPDRDGAVYYSMQDRVYYIDGSPCSKDEYDRWYAAYYDSAVGAVALSPRRHVGGLTGQELLALTQTGFYDVPVDQYYAAPVAWAAEHGITNGTDVFQFSPESPCTRGQIVTFLWRAAGCPEPESTTHPFVDIKRSDYFYKAVLWALENRITNGTSDIRFSPDDPCNRAQVVTLLYRLAGQPAVSGTSPFRDVEEGDYYDDAVLWAVANGVTNGTSETTFSPLQTCTRGQIVTFLYRDLAK